MAVKCPKCHFENPSDSKFCKECGTQLIPSEKTPVSPTKTFETPKEELTTGSTFAGRYQIIEELGKGGMGRVYRVVDKKLNEEVALKLIKPEIASDKKTIERFSNELKLARKISHRNVGRMYELMEEKGTHFITMEYVPGEDLKSFIRRSGQLTIGKAISIAKQVCEGLSEAHRLGVMHRDLKPSNIMIDKEGNTRIMDFGIARSIRGKRITDAGVMIGTPEYMSPEQVEGKDADQRSDIYSLGIILYEMVTGRVPFEGDTPFTIGMKHKSEIPKDPKLLNAQIPEDLNLLILKCLEKDKERRYQTTEEVLPELIKIEKGIPTTERVVPKRKPSTSKEITVTFSLKKLLIPALIIVVALAFLVVIILRDLPQKEAVLAPSDKPTLAIMYFKNNTGDESEDNLRTAFSDLLITGLTQSKYLKVLSGDRLLDILRQLNLVEARSYSSEDLKKVAALGGATHIVQGNYIKIAETYRIDILLQEASSMDSVGIESVDGKEENFYGMVDELIKKIKANFELSEEEIADDIDLADELAKEDFARGAVIATGDIKPPKLIKEVHPVFPEEARQKGVEGAVVVQARTDKQGNVEAVKVLKSLPLLDQAAIDAVKQWKYEPMIINGKTESIVFAVTLTFKLKKEKSGPESIGEMKWKNSIAVLPFADLSPQRDQEYFCDGLADELINRLTNIESLRVPARTSAFSFKGKELNVQEIGEKLNVDMVLEGSVRKARDKLRITVQLVKAADGYPLWSEKYERNLEDVFALQDEISLAIAEKLRIKLVDEEKTLLFKRYTRNIEAYNLYLMGRHFWGKTTMASLKKGIDYFQQAIEHDPAYALSYAGIADCYIMLGIFYIRPKEAFPRAKAAAEKALEMDEDLAAAHASLGLVRALYDWDWLGAERELKRAIEIDPNCSTAHLWYSVYLAAMGMHDDSIVEAKHARELDPISPITTGFLGNIYYYARQYDQAVKEGQKTLELDPSNFLAHILIGMAYIKKGAINEALAQMQKGLDILEKDDQPPIMRLILTYILSGKTDEMKKLFDELSRGSRKDYFSPYYIASIYLLRGQKDQTFEWLERAYEERDHWIIVLKVDPKFDNLRSDPRYKQLLKKIGLEN